jgi:hypothetical protein
MVIVSVSDVISETVSVNVIVFDETEPLRPPLKVGVPILVNLGVPPSSAVTVKVCGDDVPLPSEFASIDCAEGVTATSTFGTPLFAFV